MNLFCKVGIAVSKTDNGWVLEWKDEEHSKRQRFGGMSHFDDDERPTRGIEVFSDKEKLLQRIGQLI